MTPAEARLRDTRSWLAKAELDLRAAEHGRVAVPPITADVAFHAQQLAEKCLKAFLTFHDRAFRRVHDLGELGLQCAEIDATLEPLLKEAAVLSEYAWRFRYPGEPEEPGPEEAEEALDLARRVWQEILDRLPREARSEGADGAPLQRQSHSWFWRALSRLWRRGR